MYFSFFSFSKTKDEHKVEHRTILTQVDERLMLFKENIS